MDLIFIVLIADKANLDILSLQDESLEGSANFPAPDIIAQEIVKDLGVTISRD